jgi:hypothetical protein
MREILFRGQTRRYGEKVRVGDGAKMPSHWVYGGVLQGGGSHSVIYGGENVDDIGEGLDKHVVYTDTLGQFTGLTDKNGKKIFEGDVIRVGGDVYFCYWDDGNCEFGIRNKKESMGIAYVFCPCLEVIGNIHDNPELLEDGT